MGSNSSQLLPDNTQDTSLPLATAQSSLPVKDDTMDDPASRDPEVRLKKRRNVSGDATRPLKQPKKDREENHAEPGAPDTSGLAVEDDGQEHATGEIARKRSKKRSKKENTMRGDDEDAVAGGLATQDSLNLEETPQSTLDTTNGRDIGKRVKSKGKRPTGRPSGLNLIPEGMPDLATQEETTQNDQSSPDITNVQSSYPGPKQTKSRKTTKVHVDGTPGNTPNDEEHSPVVAKAAKSPKVSRNRRAALRGEQAAELFPTPPEATQNDQAPDLPELDQAGDDAALRDDYVEVDATSQVQGWLSSQLQDGNTPTTPRFDPPVRASRKKAKLNAHTQRERAVRPDESKPAKKHRRDSRHLEDDSEDYQLEDDDAVEEEPRSSTRKKNKRPEKQASDEDASDSGPTPVKAKGRKKTEPVSRPAKSGGKTSSDGQALAKGPFTESERTKVDKLFKETMKDTGKSDADLRVLIKDWKNATDFKEAVQAALPNRPIAAIRKFCQRRYHNMERGAWTTEDDASLKTAYAANPDKWTDISALVGRTGADCKDRWKNIVSFQDTLQTGPWSQEEAAALTEAVNKTIKELQKADKSTKTLSRPELERMISWDAVSKKLNRTRSAKRCKEKWQKLKRSEESGSGSRPSTSIQQPLATGILSTSKKLRLAEHKYNQCDVGDLYDILTEIHTAIPDHDQHYEHESTLWAIIATKYQGSRFESAMRRRGLYDAAEVYKAEIGYQPTIAASAKALADHLEEQWGIEALKDKRAYVPKSRRDKVIKSSERVVSDDDEDDDDIEEGDEEEESGGDMKDVDTETTPPTSNEEDQSQEEEEEEDEEIDELAPEAAEIPDSQPTAAVADSKPQRLEVESPISFKSINRPSKASVRSAAAERRKPSETSKKTRAKARKS